MISGLGCGNYDYLCVEIAKGDNPDPDFIFNQDGGGVPIVVCEWVPCQHSKLTRHFCRTLDVNVKS